MIFHPLQSKIGAIFLNSEGTIINSKGETLLSGKPEEFEFNMPQVDGEIYFLDKSQKVAYIVVDDDNILKYENAENIIYVEGYYSILHTDETVTLVDFFGKKIELEY